MGHSSTQVTMDNYGRKIPGGNIAWEYALDGKTSLQQNAIPAQQSRMLIVANTPQVIEENGAGEGNRTPDLRFTKPLVRGSIPFAGPILFNNLRRIGHNQHPALLSRYCVLLQTCFAIQSVLPSDIPSRNFAAVVIHRHLSGAVPHLFLS